VFEPFELSQSLSRKLENYSERSTQLQAEERSFFLSNEHGGFFRRRHDIHAPKDELLPPDEPR